MPPNQSIQPEKTDNECLDLHNASLDCQIKHGRGEACRTLIEAYKTCKKEWVSVVNWNWQRHVVYFLFLLHTWRPLRFRFCTQSSGTPLKRLYFRATSRTAWQPTFLWFCHALQFSFSFSIFLCCDIARFRSLCVMQWSFQNNLFSRTWKGLEFWRSWSPYFAAFFDSVQPLLTAGTETAFHSCRETGSPSLFLCHCTTLCEHLLLCCVRAQCSSCK